jgi:TRAP-type C4-dicarboxylate transport system permease small subunit
MRAMPFAIIIVIGWLYVTILVAANEPTIISGIISFLFYGALPCGIILYLSGSRIRRQRKRYKELAAERNKENEPG